MNDALNQAKKFVLQLKNDGINVDSAFLFGSYAKGTQHKYSDIDVCIVSPKFGKDYFDEMSLLRKKALKIDIRIEPVPLNPADLADPYSSLSTEIRNTGVALV